MLWAQAGASFAVWVAFGVFQARRTQGMRGKLAQMSRRARVSLGPLLMLAGAVVLLGGVFLLGAFHGLQNGQLALWAWLAITILGLIFVQAQSLAALMIASVAIGDEPAGSAGASDGRITDRKSDEVHNPARP